MNRDYTTLLVIREEIEFLLETYESISVGDLNGMSRRSLERAFESIGEHAKSISPELKEKYPAINWKDMVGIRNVMAHDYGRIDHEMLLIIVGKYLTNDLLELNKIISQLETHQ